MFQNIIAFVKVTIFISLTYSAFEPIRAAVLATGRITRFMIIPECFYILVLQIGFLIGKLSDNPTFMIITIVSMNVLTCLFRVYFASKVTVLQIKEIINKIIIPSALVAIVSSISCYFLNILCINDILGLCILLILNSLILIGIIYLLGLSMSKKKLVNNIITKIKKNNIL